MKQHGVLGWSGALVVSALVMTACGESGGGGLSPRVSSPGGSAQNSTPATGAASSGVAACTLLTEPELTAFLGSDPGPGMDASSGSTSSCAFTAGSAVTIGIDHGGGKSMFDAFCSTNHPQPNTQTLSGVGDGACSTIVAGAIAAMYILKGSDLLSINIQAGPDAKITPEKLTELGKLAVGRL